jgi:GST-like protein
MITLHTWTTPNGRKISIALEEMGLPYEVKPVNIGANAQFEPNFLAISPNNKIPAIVDHDAPGGAVTLFESGAILLHLAERTGRFLPASGAARAATLEWLFWQVGGVGPMFGQLGYFALRAPEKLPAAIERFREEALRLLGVMEKRLAAAPYLGGEYSIADMATYPWIVSAMNLMRPALGEGAAHLPAIDRWLAEVGARPAVQRGMAIPKTA